MRYQVGVEYNLTDALDLRAGYCYDMSPLNDATLDYLVPADNRQLFNLGFGYAIKSWTLDLSYTYLMIDDMHIPARLADGVLESDAKNGEAHMLGVSLSTKI